MREEREAWLDNICEKEGGGNKVVLLFELTDCYNIAERSQVIVKKSFKPWLDGDDDDGGGGH